MKLNRVQLKYLLIIAMVIDHIAWMLFSKSTLTGQGMHFVGRLTGPAMSLLLADGYIYTKNKVKYAIRLFAFALISWAPYCLFDYNTFPYYGIGCLGMIWTLFCGFVNLWMWDKLKTNKVIKIIIVILMCALSLLGDWCIFSVLWSYYAFIYHDKPRKKWIAFVCVSIAMCILSTFTQNVWWQSAFQLGVFMVPFLFTYCYNGKGGSKAAFHKWFFYVFYPAHLFILYLIRVNFL